MSTEVNMKKRVDSDVIEFVSEKPQKQRKRAPKAKLPKFDQKMPRRPKDSKDEISHRVQVRRFYVARREYAKKVVAANSDIPLAEKSKADLAYECLARDLDFASVKDDHNELVALVNAFERGDYDTLSTKVIYQPGLVPTITALSFPQSRVGIARIPGFADMLNLPHDIIRFCLLPYLDFRSVFMFMRVCKYVCGDAIFFLGSRAKALFGEGATPLAVSCFMNIREKYMSSRTGSMHREVMLSSLALSNNLAIKLYNEKRLKELVALSVATHGSIEASIAERERVKRVGTQLLFLSMIPFDI